MGFSKPEFGTAFAGKLYLSYYDWIRRRTYYMCNHELLAGYGILLPKSQQEDSDRSRVCPDMASVRGKNSFTTTYTHNWNHEELEAVAYSYFDKL